MTRTQSGKRRVVGKLKNRIGTIILLPLCSNQLHILITNKLQVIVVQLPSHVQLFTALWTAARQASLSITISWNLLKLTSIESAISSNHLILCHPRLFPSIFPSIQVFSSELALCIRQSNYWSFSISPSPEYSELISFRIDWFDFLAVQGTLKSLPQNTVQKPQFFGTQPSLWSNSHIHTSLLEKPQL